jgi:hypothetical protein
MTKLHHRFNREAERQKKDDLFFWWFVALLLLQSSFQIVAVQHCISTLAAALKLRLKKVFTQSRVDGQPRIVLRHFGNLAKFTQSRC